MLFARLDSVFFLHFTIFLARLALLVLGGVDLGFYSSRERVWRIGFYWNWLSSSFISGCSADGVP